LILSNTEDLHSRIEDLSSRIRELESALATSHAKNSDEQHPLLTRDQLLTGSIRKEEEDPNDTLVTSFGQLMVGGDGTAKFFGATSGAEWVISLEDDSAENGYHCVPVSVVQGVSTSLDTLRNQSSHGGATSKNDGHPNLSYGLSPWENGADLDLISASFPHSVDRTLLNIPALQKLVMRELPPREKAISLINLYYGRVAWEFDPVPRKRLIEEIFLPLYDNLHDPPVSSHAMALLYAVFGLGMFHSPEHTNYGALAHQLIVLSRACLATDCIYVNTSVTAIDAMILHVQYFEMSDDPGGVPKAWAALGTALKLAQSLGLHREPTLWKLPPEEVTRRRRTMWELVVLDLWSALHVGRPPMISRQHFDVELPLDVPDVSEAEPNFHRGKHYFSQVCLWPVLDLTLGCKGTYAAVLKLDKKLRDWVLPKTMQVPKHIPPEDQQTAYVFQRTVIFIVREITLLCLHRQVICWTIAYFAYALLEPPHDPLRSKYSRSVLAAYASACAILGRIRTLYAREPIIIARFTLFWTHSFSAAVVLGAIATRAPDCPLAETAMVEFNHAVEMFSRAQHGYRPGRLLPTLLELQTKANAAIKAYKEGTWTRPSGADAQLFPGLGGSKAEVRYTRQGQQQQQQQQQNQTGQSPSPSSPASNDGSNLMLSLESVQPTLDEYLRSFQPTQPGEAQAVTAAAAAGAVNLGGAGNVAMDTSVPSQHQHPMGIPSSDAFLRGALTGDWTSLSTAPPPDMSFMEMFGQYPAGTAQSLDFTQPSSSSRSQAQSAYSQPVAMAPLPQMMGGAPLPQQQQQQQQYQASISSAASYSHSPFSDGGGSASSGGVASQGGYGMSQGTNLQPPMQMFGHQQLGQSPPNIEASALWDNFLNDLGLPGAGHGNT
ncbi:hypothetical protein FRC17_010057, partial [Serendipita sp. 399]